MGTEQEFELLWADTPVPAARALDNFSATEVGEDEIVLFDNERLTYHTLNKPAFAVWQLCDGVRTSSEIHNVLAANGLESSVELVEYAVSELIESGMIEEEPTVVGSGLGRRAFLKGAVAGLAGGAVLPAISSITAPVGANATTCTPGSNLGAFAACACSAECAVIWPGTARCCCDTPGTGGICVTGPIGCGLAGGTGCMAT